MIIKASGGRALVWIKQNSNFILIIQKFQETHLKLISKSNINSDVFRLGGIHSILFRVSLEISKTEIIYFINLYLFYYLIIFYTYKQKIIQRAKKLVKSALKINIILL